MKHTPKQGGFTLVELAIVLVIVGLILGLAFKGRDLIDGARVKSAQASTNKIQAAVNIFFERYQRYPGDGCVVANAALLSQCGGARNGLIDNANETSSFWSLLIGTGILTTAERTSPFGTQWNVATDAINGRINTVTYLVSGTAAVGAASTATDIRYVCSLDTQYDDANPTSGNIRSNVAAGMTVGTYQAGEDCWSKSGQVAMSIRLLP
ncbi:hypothetical protein JHS3_29360 [Jeongeupia sp. HS-3]|uniref:type II secretion system protein n=1 Tax=Jeongeupia sp. HS-3 TaxID=1009682 RepID=UPI0018A62A26|nr:prepilin-type N-terminal cleavage/methylation domain-containing protein [Jeongeupia sp. HS-3]BCL77200.1 hypothetical protein JHS3_29360 [Jeongeupia sp. HS-3]